jgi:hypothetical protein
MPMVVFWWLGAATMLHAQQPNVHYWHQGVMPPGAIGSRQLQRGGPLPGFFQPVEIKVPQGALISLAVDSQFDQPRPGSRKAGMLIGSVYRMRVTNIRLAEGAEVFPTVEVIDRLYAPPGQERRFPIPIDITEEDLKLAIDGKFVTRVIYLEDPRNALPARELDKSQNWFEAAPGQDPLAVADGLGRPVAILRLGARLPDQGSDPFFFFGSPPLEDFPPEPPAVSKQSKVGAAAKAAKPAKASAAVDTGTLATPPTQRAVKEAAMPSKPNAGLTDMMPSRPGPKGVYVRAAEKLPDELAPQEAITSDGPNGGPAIAVRRAETPRVGAVDQLQSQPEPVQPPPNHEPSHRETPATPRVNILPPPPDTVPSAQHGPIQNQSSHDNEAASEGLRAS